MKDTHLSGLQENNQLEAKEALGGIPGSMWATYSAFANTEGGVILLGVSENRRHQLVATGVTNPEGMVKNIWDTLRNQNKVSANILSEDDISIETMDDARIIRISVPRADREHKPVYIDGNPIRGTYRRNFEGDYRCSQEEYLAMTRDSATGSEELDRAPLPNFSIEDFDKNTISTYRRDLKQVRPKHPWNDLSDEDFLLRINALALDGRTGKAQATRAGLLMFGQEWRIVNEFPYYFLDYREVGGSQRRWDHRIVSNDGEWSGNLYDFMTRAWQRMMLRIPRPFELQGLSRLEVTPLHNAVREALVNTLIHADYYLRGNTVVIMNLDSVEFTNPGGLLMPPEIAMAGGLSETRHPVLMKMFALLSITERAGSGFDAMRQGCEWAAMPYPKLSETFGPDRTRLSFQFDQSTRALIESRPSPAKKLSEPAMRLLAYMQNNDQITRSQAERMLGISSASTRRALLELVDDGLIVKIGQARSTRYKVTQPDDLN